MSVTSSLLRGSSKACSVVLLWLLSVSLSAAMPASRHAASKACDAKTTAVKKLVRQARAVGGPLAKRSRSYGIRRHPLPNWIQRETARTTQDTDQAIQNDSAAASVSVELDIELQRLTESVDSIEPRASTRALSPRAPRGPPHSA